MPSPKGYGQLDTLGAAKGLDHAFSGAAIPAGTDFVVFQAEGGAVRWRDDATKPTGSLGMLLADGQSYTHRGPLANLSFIRATGAAVTTKLNVVAYSL